MQRHLFFIPNSAGVRVMEQAQLINALKLSDRTHNPIIAIPQCGRDPVLPLGLTAFGAPSTQTKGPTQRVSTVRRALHWHLNGSTAERRAACRPFDGLVKAGDLFH